MNEMLAKLTKVSSSYGGSAIQRKSSSSTGGGISKNSSDLSFQQQQQQRQLFDMGPPPPSEALASPCWELARKLHIALSKSDDREFVTLLENIDIVREAKLDDVKIMLLPVLFASLESSMPQIQNAASHAIAQVIDFLDENAIKTTIIPNMKVVFESNSTVQAQAITLTCIERIIENLDKTEIQDHVIPMLLNAKLGEPLVLVPVLRMYKRMLQDKRFGLTAPILATKIMPSLTPHVVSPNLRMDEFTCLVEILQEMLEYVSRNQRNKLRLERLSMGSIDTTGIQLVRGGDSPIGYPHRPPGLRLENRRTSISVDDVIRRTIDSGASSPDSNLLRVQAQLPGRRHSDNTIQLPRIQVNSSTPPAGYSRRSSGPAGGSPIFRRHSQGTPGFQAYWQGLSSLATGYNFNKPSNIDFVIPSYQRGASPTGGRRYSAAPTFGVGQPSSFSAQQGNSLLQTIETGMHGPRTPSPPQHHISPHHQQPSMHRKQLPQIPPNQPRHQSPSRSPNFFGR